MRRLRARENLSRAPGAPRDPALRVLRPVREELAGRRRASALRTQARPGAGGEATVEPLKRRDGAPGGERVSQNAHRAGQTSGANCVHLFALGAERQRAPLGAPSPTPRGKTDDTSGVSASRQRNSMRHRRAEAARRGCHPNSAVAEFGQSNICEPGPTGSLTSAGMTKETSRGNGFLRRLGRTSEETC
jgi:hypothetical protein